MSHLEVEIKFYISDIGHTRNVILQQGAEPESSCFETNIRFDDVSGTLCAGHKLLRLRQDSVCRLTVKAPPEFSSDEITDHPAGQFKIFREYEVTVSDFQTMSDMLKQLGFYPRQIYEKHRETFRLCHTELCLDTLPYGHFLEIEGEGENIRHVARLLGLDWEKRITANYLRLFENIRQYLHLPFEDVTFDNFKGVVLDASVISRLIETA